jgi:carboxylate-amine ligase
VAASASGGGPDDYTLLWWDVRPHPRLGTVEIRELDAQSRLDDAAAIAALGRGLARAAAESPSTPVPSEAIEWSLFRAARDGLQAEILHDGRLMPLPEAARQAVARAGNHGDADGDTLGGVDRILRDGNGAARQRVAASRGGAPAILDLLVEETAAGPDQSSGPP